VHVDGRDLSYAPINAYFCHLLKRQVTGYPDESRIIVRDAKRGARGARGAVLPNSTRDSCPVDFSLLDRAFATFKALQPLKLSAITMP
jgi:hypothetical protein